LAGILAAGTSESCAGELSGALRAAAGLSMLAKRMASEGEKSAPELRLRPA
jgi:hypothetical protein